MRYCFKNIEILFLILFVFSACKYNNNNDLATFRIPTFPEEQHVTTYKLNINKVMDVCRGMTICGSYLIVSCANENGAVQAFDKNAGKFIKTLAPLGRNTDEVFSIFTFPCCENQDQLYLLNEPGKSKCLIYNIKDTLMNKPDKVVFFNILGSVKDFMKLKDNLFLISASNIIYFIDSTGNPLKDYSKFPLIKDVQDTTDIKSLFFIGDVGKRMLCIKPDKTKFVRRSASDLISMLEIFNISDTVITKYKELRFCPPAYETIKEYNFGGVRSKILGPNDKSIKGIVDISVSDKYIYILFNDKLSKMKNTYYKTKEIWCFDWDGNPVKKYVINGLGVKRMAIDVNLNRMYLVQHGPQIGEHFTYFNL